MSDHHNFALIGVAGYIAPRHLKAIKETGNTLVAALDPHDNVGLLDNYFPDARFFTEFERFDRHIEKIRRKNQLGRVDYVSICSPNYLHDAHIRFALRVGAHAICEKPLVLNPWNIDALKELEDEHQKNVFTILQLRVHPALVELKKQLSKQTGDTKQIITLTYITSRGAWYLSSWKGNLEKSGGLATNIGIHFFDLLIWLFGPVTKNEVHVNEPRKVSGYLELEHANVQWYLSIDASDLTADMKAQGKRTFRSLTVDGREIEFSEGFTDLHTVVYRELLAGRGFSLDDARPAIVLAHDIRIAKPLGLTSSSHPLAKSTEKK